MRLRVANRRPTTRFWAAMRSGFHEEESRATSDGQYCRLLRDWITAALVVRRSRSAARSCPRAAVDRFACRDRWVDDLG